MMIQLLRAPVLDLFDSATNGTLKKVIEVARRRGPEAEVHVVAGHPRERAGPDAPVALAVVVIEDGIVYGMTIHEMSAPEHRRAATGLAILDVASAHGVAGINIALPALVNDPVGRQYDFGVTED